MTASTSAQTRMIEAIRRIAKTDPEIRSTLTLLRDRGVLEAVTSTVGVGETLDGGEDCCVGDDPDTGEEEEEEDSGDGNDGTIDGERPDDGQNEKNMDGRFRGPDGELFDWDDEPCVPDSDWVQGVVWSGDVESFPLWTYFPSPSFIYDAMPDSISVAGGRCLVGKSGYYISGNYIYVEYHASLTSSDYCNTFVQRNKPTRAGGSRLICSGFAPGKEPDDCHLTEPPCIEEEWPSDGKCQEALINGKFIPHPKDPDCAGRGPRDYQVMCDSEHCIAYIPTKDGGHMRVEVDPVTRLPVAGSDMTFYGSDGKPKSSTEYRYDNVKYNAYGPNSVPGNWGE